VTRKDGKESAVTANLRHIIPHLIYYFISLVAVARFALLHYLESNQLDPFTNVPIALPFALFTLGMNLWSLWPPIKFFAFHSSPFDNFTTYADACGLLLPPSSSQKMR